MFAVLKNLSQGAKRTAFGTGPVRNLRRQGRGSVAEPLLRRRGFGAVGVGGRELSVRREPLHAAERTQRRDLLARVVAEAPENA